MLYLVEYDRPAADYPSADGDDANFDTVFEGPVPWRNELVPQLAEWIIDYGKANGATAAHVFEHLPKRLSGTNLRLPGSQQHLCDFTIP